MTVAIPNYNGRHDLADLIRSVQNSTDPPTEILLVDDGSTDGSIAFVREMFPDVRIIDLKTNSGGIPNKARNRALREAGTRLVFLVDHDIVLAPSCISVLVSHMRALPDAGALTMRALYREDPTRIYFDAQSLHYLCNTVAMTRDRPVSEADHTPRPSVGWGTMVVDKEKAALVGNLDVPRLLRKRSMLQRLWRRPDRELLVGGPIYVRQSVLESRPFDWACGC